MIDIVVPVSGGKDSQACLKLAVTEYGPDRVRGLFNDTRFEHPLTYQHIEKLKEVYGVRIDTVCGGSVIEKCIKYNRFPGGGARFCTEELKMRESKIYYKALALAQGQGFQVWAGMRLDESHARGKKYADVEETDLLDMHELFPSKFPKYLGKMGVFMRLPILHWLDAEIFQYLEGKHNPLYDKGFDRVGCFPCLASGDAWKTKAFEFDGFGREQYRKVQELEVLFSRSIFTSKKVRRPGCMLCSI